MGRGQVLGQLDPFGLALVASLCLVARRNALPVGLAAALGVAHRAGPGAGTAFALQALAVGAAFSAWRRRRGPLDRPVAAAVVAAVALAGSLVSAGSLTPLALTAAGFQAGLAALSAVIFTQGLVTLAAPDAARHTAGDPAGLFFLFAAALAGAGGLSVAGLGLAELLAAAAVTAVGFAGGPTLGAVGGLGAGAVAALAGPFDPAAVGAAGLAGLLAGAFRDFGRGGAAAGYALGRLAVALAAPSTGLALGSGSGPALAASAVGAGLVALAPRRAWERAAAWLEAVAGPAGGRRRERLEDRAARRVREFAGVCSDLARAFEEAAAADAGTRAPAAAPAGGGPQQPGDHLVAALTERLCQGCAYYRTCWEQHFFSVYRGSLELFARLDEAGQVPPEQAPDAIRRHCRYLDEFLLQAAHLAEMARRDRVWERRLAEVAGVIPAQLDGVAATLAGLVRELEGGPPPGAGVAARAGDHLRGAGEPVTDVAAVETSPGRLEFTVRRRPCETGDACRARVAPEMGRALGRPVRLLEERCTWRLGEPTCTFHLATTPALGYRVRTHEAAKAGMAVSGDSHCVRESSDGRLLVILSDGVGSGRPAAADSRTTVTLVERLLDAGLPTDTVVRTVNAVLLSRGGGERYSTVDMAVVDLHSCAAQLLKRGAAPAYLWSGKVLRLVQAPSLPLGVVPGGDVAPQSAELGPGDLMVLATDGLWGPDGPGRPRQDWVWRLLERMPDAGPEEVADALFAEAQRRQAGGWADDVTLVVVGFVAAGAAS